MRGPTLKSFPLTKRSTTSPYSSTSATTCWPPVDSSSSGVGGCTGTAPCAVAMRKASAASSTSMPAPRDKAQVVSSALMPACAADTERSCNPLQGLWHYQARNIPLYELKV